MTILAILTKFCLKFANLVNFAMSFFCLALSALSPPKSANSAMSFFNASTKFGTFWRPQNFNFCGERRHRLPVNLAERY